MIINGFFLKEKFKDINGNPSNSLRLLIEDFYFSKILSSTSAKNINFLNIHKKLQDSNVNFNCKTFKDNTIFFSLYMYFWWKNFKNFQMQKKDNNNILSKLTYNPTSL